MSNFKRGLGPDLVRVLEEEYNRLGWWYAMANDPELFIAIRDEYLNVYWKGNSLLKLFLQDGRLVGEVHYKYMLRPKSNTPYLRIEGGKVMSANHADYFLSDLSSIEYLKNSADIYAGPEKSGVHKIVMSNPNVIDVEIAFGTENEQSGAKVAQRIDFAALRLESQGPELVFYEAKTFTNSELRADGDHVPRVINQLKRYRDFLRDNESDVIDSYRRICSNLFSFYDIREDKNRISAMSDLLGDIGSGKCPLKINPNVRLVVFGYDRDQDKGDIWKPHRKKLETHLADLYHPAGTFLLMKGDPKGFTAGISSPSVL